MLIDYRQFPSQDSTLQGQELWLVSPAVVSLSFRTVFDTELVLRNYLSKELVDGLRYFRAPAVFPALC